jgi:glutathione peroxidase
MAHLQVLEEQFAGQGFHVLGFFSNNFGNQGGDPAETEACNAAYGITFPEFAMDHVIDPDGPGPEEPQPVWQWILAQPSPGPEQPIEPTWNFHKYLVSKDGELIAHFGQSETPGPDPDAPEWESNIIVQSIRAELAR